MPDNFLIVPSADVSNGRLTSLANAISTNDLNLTVTSLANGTELVVYQLSQSVTGTPQPTTVETETHVFALIGQSNMIGRANFDGGSKWPAGTLQIGRGGSNEGTLLPALNPADGPSTARPLAHVNPTVGDMGLDIQFAIDYLSDKPNVTLLFVPCAQGGTGFSDNAWNPGNALYNSAVSRTNAAMAANPDFLFKGFLWHQGETDAGIPGTYAGLLDNMITAIRSDVIAADPTTPFVLGGLGSGNAAKDEITAIIAETPNRLAYTAFASAEGLGLIDAHHFNAASLRVLGSRYASAVPVAAEHAPGLPGAPTAVNAVAGNAQISLTWAAPASTGSAALTDYIIERNSGTGFAVIADGSGTATDYTDSGLTNGTAYTYRIRATNSIGTGAASAPDSATPAAVSSGPTAESGAEAHWLFGSDNPTYADMVSARVATGPAHALSAGYMTSPTGTRQGRDSGIPEADEQTMCFVFRLASGLDSMVGGTLQIPGDDISEGVSPYTKSPSGIFVNMRRGWGNTQASSTSAIRTDFVFTAVSKNRTTQEYVLFTGNQSGNASVSGNSAQTTSPRTIGIGNLHFSNANFSGQISIAETIIFDGAKTTTELEAIYERSRARLATRGVTVE